MDDTTNSTGSSHAHEIDAQARRFYPSGIVPWSADRTCSYCGSMHPADVAAAIRAGAVGHWADWKYGWPHKAYFSGGGLSHAKFYSVHLQDASSEDRETIQQHLGLSFEFKHGSVGWRRCGENAANAPEFTPPDVELVPEIKFTSPPAPTAQAVADHITDTVGMLDALHAEEPVVQPHAVATTGVAIPRAAIINLMVKAGAARSDIFPRDYDGVVTVFERFAALVQKATAGTTATKS